MSAGGTRTEEEPRLGEDGLLFQRPERSHTTRSTLPVCTYLDLLAGILFLPPLSLPFSCRSAEAERLACFSVFITGIQIWGARMSARGALCYQGDFLDLLMIFTIYSPWWILRENSSLGFLAAERTQSLEAEGAVRAFLTECGSL